MSANMYYQMQGVGRAGTGPALILETSAYDPRTLHQSNLKQIYHAKEPKMRGISKAKMRAQMIHPVIDQKVNRLAQVSMLGIVDPRSYNKNELQRPAEYRQYEGRYTLPTLAGKEKAFNEHFGLAKQQRYSTPQSVLYELDKLVLLRDPLDNTKSLYSAVFINSFRDKIVSGMLSEMSPYESELYRELIKRSMPSTEKKSDSESAAVIPSIGPTVEQPPVTGVVAGDIEEKVDIVISPGDAPPDMVSAIDPDARDGDVSMYPDQVRKALKWAITHIKEGSYGEDEAESMDVILDTALLQEEGGISIQAHEQATEQIADMINQQAGLSNPQQLSSTDPKLNPRKHGDVLEIVTSEEKTIPEGPLIVTNADMKKITSADEKFKWASDIVKLSEISNPPGDIYETKVKQIDIDGKQSRGEIYLKTAIKRLKSKKGINKRLEVGGGEILLIDIPLQMQQQPKKQSISTGDAAAFASSSQFKPIPSI